MASSAATVAALPYRSRTYSAQDGLRLHFRDYGDSLSDALPLLCLPGIARNAEDFDAVARRHMSHRRVICPDLRGRGDSAFDPNWRNYTGRTYASDLIHLLTLTNCHRVVILGTSMGGILAMVLATFVPSAIAGVILNDVGPQVPDGSSARIVQHVGHPGQPADWDAAVVELKQRLPGMVLADQAAWLAFAKSQFRADGDGVLRPRWDPNIVRPIAEKTEEEVDLWQFFRAMRGLPVLAIRGAISDVLPAEVLDRMAASHPALRHVTVPGVGHVPTLAEPIAQQAIDDFLADL